MKLPWLKSAIETPGPFTTVYLDTTRTGPNAAADLEARWATLRSALAAEGSPDALLAQIEESLLEAPPLGGQHGRAIIATDDEILVDRILPVPPQQESAQHGEFPSLLPLLRLTPYAVSQLLVVVDRAGADLHLRAPENPSIAQGPNALGDDASVEGGHDELHKASLGGGNQHGWRSNNFEARVEDSWERNADTVAASVERILRERDPDMVMLSGDVRAMGLLKDALGREPRERLIEVQGGTRGVGLERASFREEIGRITEAFIAARQQELADRFHESQARDAASVGGAAEVAEALERGQVDELIFLSGHEPENIEALLRDALLTDAAISAIDLDTVDLPEGVGALLRWKDGATPSNRIGSMSGDSRREDAVAPPL